MFVLNLAHFFTRLYGEGSRAANSKLTYIWTPSSRSYIVFALVKENFSRWSREVIRKNLNRFILGIDNKNSRCKSRYINNSGRCAWNIMLWIFWQIQTKIITNESITKSDNILLKAPFTNKFFEEQFSSQLHLC